MRDLSLANILLSIYLSTFLFLPIAFYLTFRLPLSLFSYLSISPSSKLTSTNLSHSLILLLSLSFTLSFSLIQTFEGLSISLSFSITLWQAGCSLVYLIGSRGFQQFTFTSWENIVTLAACAAHGAGGADPAVIIMIIVHDIASNKAIGLGMTQRPS